MENQQEVIGKSDVNKLFDSGITEIRVSGFKSILDEIEVSIQPLTIIAGANSSGKSSVMQPLLLLKQTLEASYDPGALLLYGPNVRYTSARQFLSNLVPNSSNKHFTVTFCINSSGQSLTLSTTYKQHKNKSIDIERMEYIGEEGEATSLRPKMSHRRLLSELPPSSKQWIKIISKELKQRVQWEVTRKRCFLSTQWKFDSENSNTFSSMFAFDPSELFEKVIREVIHVPGLRGNPTRSYKTTAISNVFPGTFENYVASIINHWQRTKDARLKQLEQDLYILGLTQRLDAHQLDDTQVELRVGRLSNKGEEESKEDMVNIADVGLGVSQVLPVLVALLTAKPGQLVYIEQPEIHLHPRAQAGLAKALVAAARRKVHLVVETHSNLLLTSLQTEVATGVISPTEVILHWFQRDEKGQTIISSSEPDRFGAYGDWPEDFAEVSLIIESQYLDAVESQLIEEVDDEENF